MEDFYRARALTTSNVIVGIVADMGIMGLLFALVGLYALVAHAVAQRTREIGIRLAAGVAALIPAQRAARIDPLIAIRQD